MSFFPKDFHLIQSAITAQRYTGSSSVAYPGYNNNLSSGVEATLNPLGLGIMTTPSDSGELLKVVSSNAADVGILIVCEVLNHDGVAQISIAILNGTTPVDLIDVYQQPILVSRVNSVINRSSSPGTLTLGDVIVTDTAGTTTYNGFLARDQRSFCLIFTIPSDKMGVFLPAESTLNKSGGNAATSILRTKTRVSGGPWINNGRWGLHEQGTSAFLFETADEPYIPPFTDIMITAESDTGSTDVTGRVPINLMPANYFSG